MSVGRKEEEKQGGKKARLLWVSVKRRDQISGNLGAEGINMWEDGGVARRVGGAVISSILKQRATPEDSPLIHTAALQARTSLQGDMKHKHKHT